eukprot:5809168-Pleurochrysis_carterae.AAC.1
MASRPAARLRQGRQAATLHSEPSLEGVLRRRWRARRRRSRRRRTRARAARVRACAPRARLRGSRAQQRRPAAAPA